MQTYFAVLISIFFFNLSAQSYKKIRAYIEKQKFTKARILLQDELRLYDTGVYGFPKSVHSAFIHPNLNYLVYLFIIAQKSTFSTYDTLDILNWHINHARHYLNNLTDSSGFDYSITDKKLLNVANNMIDQKAYQILKQNYNPRNLEHFITLYSQNFKGTDLTQLVEAYLHSNFIMDMTKCKTDERCLQAVGIYYQNQHKEEVSKIFIRSYTDSVIYNYALDTNKVADLEFYIRNYPHGRQTVHIQHRLFSKLLENEILIQEKMKRILCQDANCPFNPSNWHSTNSTTKSIVLPLQDLKSRNFGFKTLTGKVVITPEYDIPIDYLHKGNLKTDFLKVYVNNQLRVINLKGEIIIPKAAGLDDVSNFNDLLLLTYRKGLYGLYNKNGFEILAPRYQSISLFNSNSDFIKVQLNDRFGVIDYLNNILLPTDYNDIIQEKQAIFGRVLDTYNLFKIETIAGKPIFQLKRKVKGFTSYNQVLKIETFSGKIDILNRALHPILENLDSFEPAENFFVAKRADEYFILDSMGQFYFSNLRPIEAFKQNQNYWALKFRGLWGLYDRTGHILLYHRYKNLELFTSGLLLNTPENQSFYYHNEELTAFNPKAKIVQDIEINGKYYAVIGERKFKLIEIGKRTLLTNYDAIEIFQNGNILLERAGLKKVINLTNLRKNIFGQTFHEMIPTRHNPHLFQTFKNSKFGLLHILDGWSIPNIYQQSIKHYSDSFCVARKQGAWGLINSRNEILLDFQFDAFKPYTDNLILLEWADTFQVYDIEKRQRLNFTFETYIITEDNILIFKNESGFGILKSDGKLYFKKTYEEPLEYEDNNLVITLDKSRSRLNWYMLEGKLVNSVILTPEQYRQLSPFLIFNEE